ncbi:uncharacterized protein KY384_006544 [Bacidia gigantensis]|uniref:uncharacterized protein n=1 Tax=Bacidia gigantensis TaxID=2732470 RepID=UPI001D04692D|nr:uncharacterized protein KY384_006544 [Bacidia gigantensis]KAG8528855.1 hypothetical protein KY384_006544 [Bacidia gigantensis]
MSTQKAPRAVLFDIGGVIVSLTKWGMAASGKGELTVGNDFFQDFTKDLCSENAWQQFHQSDAKSLKEKANPSQLGDHVSLKAEAADSEPTHDDRGAQGTLASDEDLERKRPSLSKLAEDTTIGDPVSLESEEVVQGQNEKGAGATGGRDSPQSSNSQSTASKTPRIDGETLFWSVMSASRQRDPYVFPALERLAKQKSRPILGALSNTVKYPPEHAWSKPDQAYPFNPESVFDIYISSSEIGMRKPSKDIYEFALQKLNEKDKERGGQGIGAGDVVFLDDIGENLKVAKEVGMRTINVQLGKTWRAVKELERMLDADLMDEKTRRAKL